MIFKKKITDQNRISDNFKKGFFVSFPGTYSDEKRYADEVFKNCGSHFSTIIHQPHELPDLISKTTEHFDTIYWTPLCTLTPLYQKIADEKYKISLDGHGVDEMLFGYTDMLRKLSCASRDAGHQLYADKIHEVETQLTQDPNNASQNPYFHHEKYSYKHRIPLSAKFKISAGRIRNFIFPYANKQRKHLEKPPPHDLGPNEPPSGFESFDPISQEFFFKPLSQQF